MTSQQQHHQQKLGSCSTSADKAANITQQQIAVASQQQQQQHRLLQQHFSSPPAGSNQQQQSTGSISSSLGGACLLSSSSPYHSFLSSYNNNNGGNNTTGGQQLLYSVNEGSNDGDSINRCYGLSSSSTATGQQNLQQQQLQQRREQQHQQSQQFFNMQHQSPFQPQFALPPNRLSVSSTRPTSYGGPTGRLGVVGGIGNNAGLLVDGMGTFPPSTSFPLDFSNSASGVGGNGADPSSTMAATMGCFQTAQLLLSSMIEMEVDSAATTATQQITNVVDNNNSSSNPLLFLQQQQQYQQQVQQLQQQHQLQYKVEDSEEQQCQQQRRSQQLEFGGVRGNNASLLIHQQHQQSIRGNVGEGRGLNNNTSTSGRAISEVSNDSTGVASVIRKAATAAVASSSGAKSSSTTANGSGNSSGASKGSLSSKQNASNLGIVRPITMQQRHHDQHQQQQQMISLVGGQLPAPLSHPSSQFITPSTTSMPTGIDTATVQSIPHLFNPLDTFCTVPGRLSLLSNTPKYKVTVGEIHRRINPPECLNASVLGGILRRAKSKDGGKSLRDQLKMVGLVLPTGRRKATNVNSLTALVEYEAFNLAKDFHILCENEFPAKPIADYLTYKAISIDASRMEIQKRRNMVVAAKSVLGEMLELLKNDRSPVCQTVLRPVLDHSVQKHLTHFSLMTHGFGNPAMLASLSAIMTLLNELDKNLDTKLNC